MSIKCVIFDMDGTLIDSKKAICKTINHMRACMQMPELDDDFIMSIINDPQKKKIKELKCFCEIKI
ncbi:MAG: HAD family hydrolase [Campylobacter hyointestinalis]